MAHVLGLLDGNVSGFKNVKELEETMERIVKILNLNEVSRAFHQFEPYGATGVIVLAESHFSAHTYPENDRIYVDMFCCSKDFDPKKAADVITREFDADTFMWETIKRS
jgi:S-adenosylmethionine decarboxylase proenzyme